MVRFTLVQDKLSVVVYTPANMNAIDGSSVWTQSVTLALAGVANVDVTLLLSHAITNERMVGPLLRNPQVSVIDAVSRKNTKGDLLQPDEAASIIARMKGRGPQIVLVRGVEAAARLAQKTALEGKIWPYLTDIPQRADDIDATAEEQMETIMAASPVLLCQTEELATFLETHFPPAKGKGWVLPPAIPEGLSPRILAAPTRNDLRLCYSGKFASKWNTYEMCDLPAELAKRSVSARLTMVGDKVNQDPEWPQFVTEMVRKLETAAGVEWVGGVNREQSIEFMSAAHIGLSWRSPELDHSLELSTKLLEYCAVGTPPLVNRTEMHERIFGEDYPLLVEPGASVVDLLESMTRDPDMYHEALDRISGIPGDYTLDKATQRLAGLLETKFPGGAATRRKTGIIALFGDHSR
ncbi:MAG TPA: glycosyltransferase [Acidimicrobiia bacterium]|nr:glycosyltransferase [Acidimicrobiia bacterium]